jgi:hypothetical protein
VQAWKLKRIEAKNERERMLLGFEIEQKRAQLKAIEELEESMGHLMGARRSDNVLAVIELSSTFPGRYAGFKEHSDLYSSLEEFDKAGHTGGRFKDLEGLYDKALEQLAQLKREVGEKSSTSSEAKKE